MAARSSKDQWRAFLRNLIRQSNPGRDCKLTQRQAFAKLSEKFGADVSASDRQWVKDAMCDIQQGIYDGKIAAQKVLSKNKRQVLLSSSDERHRSFYATSAVCRRRTPPHALHVHVYVRVHV